MYRNRNFNRYSRPNNMNRQSNRSDISANGCQAMPEHICKEPSKYGTDYNNQPAYNAPSGIHEMKCPPKYDFPHKQKDYGPDPFVININKAAKENDTFRTALWTGHHLQLTLMSIKVGEEIGLEMHPHLDQFIRIEEGQGLIKMGDCKDNLDFQEMIYDDFALIIPAGKWHNLINTGCIPLKLYSIYAPPQHPKGTVHETRADAEASERYYHR